MNYRHYSPAIQGNTPQRTNSVQNMPQRQQSSAAHSSAAGKPQTREASPQRNTQTASMPQKNQPRAPQQQQNSGAASSGTQQHRSVRVSSNRPQNTQKKQLRPPVRPQPKQAPPPKKTIGTKSLSALLQGFIPSSVYNPKSKKLFGLFSAEDLLLVALIFLCAESEDEDNSMMILALLYILASEYIDLPDLAF